MSSNIFRQLLRKTTQLSGYPLGLLLLFAVSTPGRPQVDAQRLQSFGLQGLQIKALAHHSPLMSNSFLYAAVDDSGIFRLDISSAQVEWVHLGLPEKKFTALDVQVWGVVTQSPIVAVTPDYVRGDSTLIYRFEDPHWLPADSGISTGFPLHLTALASFAAKGHETPNFAFAGSAEDFLFRSPTPSKRWEWLRGYHGIHTPTLLVIGAHQKGSRQEVWIGGDTGPHSFRPIIQKSTDLGTTWQELPINLDLGLENTCSAFAFHPYQADLVYAGMTGAVIKSLDGGQTWAFTGLRDWPLHWQFRALALDAFNPDHMYAGAMNFTGSSWALWESVDAGENWTAISPPLSSSGMDLRIIDIVADPLVSGVIYIATAGDGIWKYSSGSVAVQEPNSEYPPRIFALQQNYPNPFNAGTRIRFHLPAAMHVRMLVFNAQGKEVAVLHDRALPAGAHDLVWSGDDNAGRPMASGIYFCRLETVSGTLIKKMLLTH